MCLCLNTGSSIQTLSSVLLEICSIISLLSWTQLTVCSKVELTPIAVITLLSVCVCVCVCVLVHCLWELLHCRLHSVFHQRTVYCLQSSLQTLTPNTTHRRRLLSEAVIYNRKLTWHHAPRGSCHHRHWQSYWKLSGWLIPNVWTFSLSHRLLLMRSRGKGTVYFYEYLNFKGGLCRLVKIWCRAWQ